VAQWCMRMWARSMLVAAGAKVVVHHPERILRGRGAVYACNHVSWFDVFAIASVLPRYTFIAKSELRKLPIFGWGAESAGVVFLTRDNRKSAFESYKSAAAEVTSGKNVVVFPEGTRGREYALRPFKNTLCGRSRRGRSCSPSPRRRRSCPCSCTARAR
jgi:1-acyl-sn-glycerol-3-phosphate acyltransferase